MKAKILITGGTGYIGSHTAVELIQSIISICLVLISNAVAKRVSGESLF